MLLAFVRILFFFDMRLTTPRPFYPGMLHFLEMNNWIDPATEIVTVRVPGYNYHHGVFVMAEIIFEFERGGKIEPKLKMAAMKLSNYPNSSRSWLEIIFAVAFMGRIFLFLSKTMDSVAIRSASAFTQNFTAAS